MNVFVTGTDTGCGKTWVSAGLLRAATASGLTTVGLKPIASGAQCVDGRWLNDDVEALREASSVKSLADEQNTYLFPAPASPHIAARLARDVVEIAPIIEAYGRARNAADFVVVEGVGGWLVPLNESQTVADLAEQLALPVLLVVGVQLGCINHALLTMAAIARSRVTCCGWIANLMEPDLIEPEDVIASLVERLPAPLLAITRTDDPHALVDAVAALRGP